MEYKKYDKSTKLQLKKIENVLQTLPKIKNVKLEFNKNIIELDDPIKFVCKGEQGGYVLIFTWEFIEKWNGHTDVMCSCLEEDILYYNIYPKEPMESYICTYSGIYKV